MHRYLTESAYQTVLQTYSDATLTSNWKALFVLMDFFFQQQRELAQVLNFKCNVEEAIHVRQLVDAIYALD